MVVLLVAKHHSPGLGTIWSSLCIGFVEDAHGGNVGSTLCSCLIFSRVNLIESVEGLQTIVFLAARGKPDLVVCGLCCHWATTLVGTGIEVLVQSDPSPKHAKCDPGSATWNAVCSTGWDLQEWGHVWCSWIAGMSKERGCINFSHTLATVFALSKAPLKVVHELEVAQLTLAIAVASDSLPRFHPRQMPWVNGIADCRISVLAARELLGWGRTDVWVEVQHHSVVHLNPVI